SYELELALERIPAGESAVPWLPDRLLRHLLVDRTGDVRRAEIAIDDLFPPDDGERRLGRIVLRAFETPPDARMATLQSHLVAALVARAARAPRPPALACRSAVAGAESLLPATLWADLRMLVHELAAAGYPLELAWFEPFLELHFPLQGRLQMGDVGL